MAPRTLILVEGESDAGAVRALAQLPGCGLDLRHFDIQSASAGASVDPGESLELHGFFACVADLEDELIRALGTAGVERVLEEQAEIASFRRFQAMPQHRDTPVHQQLHRFLGTRATRKIRSAQRLVEALGLARLPRPLRQLASCCATEASS